MCLLCVLLFTYNLLPMHELSTCPRCGNLFECKPGNVTQCGCYGIVVSPEVRKELEKYESCVCANCLKTLTENKSADTAQRDN